MRTNITAAAALFIQAVSLNAAAQPSGVPQPEDLTARISGVLELHVGAVPGASAAVVTPDGEVFAAAAGLARRDPARPMTTASRLFSGSIGKTYCAAVLMQLVDEGRLSLDDHVSAHLGEHEWYPRLPNAAEMTVRHAANHQTGIREHVWQPEFTEALGADPLKTWKPEEILAFVFDAEPLFPAGEGWAYADTNYIVLGMVIEAVTGEPYEAELGRRVLEPLALDDTVTSSQPELPGLVSGYTRLHTLFPVTEEVAADGVYCMNPQFEWTGGGVVSTTSDLARLMHEVCAGSLVSEESRREMRNTVPAPQLGPGAEYGIGLFTRRPPAGPMLGHTGIFPGFLSAAWHLPDCGWTVAAQINADTPEAGAALELLVAELASIARSAQTD